MFFMVQLLRMGLYLTIAVAQKDPEPQVQPALDPAIFRDLCGGSQRPQR
jgi:hypothetical protein